MIPVRLSRHQTPPQLLQLTSSTPCLTHHLLHSPISRRSKFSSIESDIFTLKQGKTATYRYYHYYYYYRVVEEYQSSPSPVEEITSSFFSLLENILRAEGPASTSAVWTHVRASHKYCKVCHIAHTLTPLFSWLSWRRRFNCGSPPQLVL